MGNRAGCRWQKRSPGAVGEREREREIQWQNKESPFTCTMCQSLDYQLHWSTMDQVQWSQQTHITSHTSHFPGCHVSSGHGQRADPLWIHLKEESFHSHCLLSLHIFLPILTVCICKFRAQVDHCVLHWPVNSPKWTCNANYELSQLSGRSNDSRRRIPITQLPFILWPLATLVYSFLCPHLKPPHEPNLSFLFSFSPSASTGHIRSSNLSISNHLLRHFHCYCCVVFQINHSSQFIQLPLEKPYTQQQ